MTYFFGNRSASHPIPSRPTRLEASTSEAIRAAAARSEEHTSELQSQSNLVCRLLLEKNTMQTTKCCTNCQRSRQPPRARTYTTRSIDTTMSNTRIVTDTKKSDKTFDKCRRVPTSTTR